VVYVDEIMSKESESISSTLVKEHNPDEEAVEVNQLGEGWNPSTKEIPNAEKPEVEHIEEAQNE
jgi:hypothetical protein